MVFWQTLAIINAIWAAEGEVDGGTFVHLGLVAWSLWELHRAERAERGATRRALDPT